MRNLSFPDPGLLRVGILLQLHPGHDEVVGTDLQGLLTSHHDPATQVAIQGS